MGDPNDPATGELTAVVWESYLSNKVVMPASEADAQSRQTMPLLAGRALQNGRPTAYVCEQFTCKQPVNDPEALRTQLTPKGKS